MTRVKPVLNKTKSLIFVLLCALCFQTQPIRFLFYQNFKTLVTIESCCNICYSLRLKILADDILKYFLIFPRKQVLTICMKCEILLSRGKNKKNISNLFSGEFSKESGKG